MEVWKNKQEEDDDEIFHSYIEIEQIKLEQMVNNNKGKVDVVAVELPTIKEEPVYEITDVPQESEFGTDQIPKKTRKYNRTIKETAEERKVKYLQRRRENCKRCYMKKMANETAEERDRRLLLRREGYASKRRNNIETVKSRERRLRAKRTYYERKRLNLMLVESETPECREHRLHLQRKYYESRKGLMLMKRENETLEHRERRLKKHREYYRKYRLAKALLNETAEEKNMRLKKQRERWRKSYTKKKGDIAIDESHYLILNSTETIEYRVRRLKSRRDHYQKECVTRKTARSEEHERKLLLRREWYARRKADTSISKPVETEEEHAERLARRRQQYNKVGKSKYLLKMATESAEQREHRLSLRRAYYEIKKITKNTTKTETALTIKNESV